MPIHLVSGSSSAFSEVGCRTNFAGVTVSNPSTVAFADTGVLPYGLCGLFVPHFPIRGAPNRSNRKSIEEHSLRKPRLK